MRVDHPLRPQIRVATAAAVLLGSLVVGTAQSAPLKPDTRSPLALTKALYAAEQASLADSGRPPWATPRHYFDARLARLFEEDESRAEREEIGNLQFDPLCDGQDCEVTDLSFSPRPATRARATIDVRFRNFGAPRHMVVTLTLGREGWRIDEIVKLAKKDGWKLSALLVASDH